MMDEILALIGALFVFSLWSPLFWIYSFGSIILWVYLLERRKYFWLPVSILCMVAIFARGLEGFHPITWIAQNPLKFLLYTVAYFGCGALYGFAKWYSFCQRLADKWEAYRDKKIKQDPNLGGDRLPVLITEFHRQELNYGESFPPAARDYAAKIIHWIGYWPISALWTLLDDPLRRIAQWLYYRVLAGTYEKIARRVFGRFEEFKNIKPVN